MSLRPASFCRQIQVRPALSSLCHTYRPRHRAASLLPRRQYASTTIQLDKNKLYEERHLQAQERLSRKRADFIECDKNWWQSAGQVSHQQDGRPPVLTVSNFDQIAYHHIGCVTTVSGFLTKVHNINKNLVFAELLLNGQRLQIVHSVKYADPTSEEQKLKPTDGADVTSKPSPGEILKALALYTPVRVTGIIGEKVKKSPGGATKSSQGQSSNVEGPEVEQMKDNNSANTPSMEQNLKTERSLEENTMTDGDFRGAELLEPGSNFVPEILIHEIEPLNTGPNTIITPTTVFGPADRHLQIRTDNNLLKTLKLRAKVASRCRRILEDLNFVEVETPLLFKSTPEGAREFLVPTRQKGLMYALPQSPQQYKQILMASGMTRYYQLAKCFRDEDLRADRQPEFSQLDLEMGFVDGEHIMKVIESLLKELFSAVLGVRKVPPKTDNDLSSMLGNGAEPFKRMKYHDAISKYGSDKPDLRISWEIKDLTSILGHTERPDTIYEGFAVSGVNISRNKFDSISAELFHQQLSSDDFPAHHSIDKTAFLLHHKKTGKLFDIQPRESREVLEKLEQALGTDDGHIYIVAKRTRVFSPGGSTSIGDLRKRLHRILVDRKHIPPHNPQDFKLLWVTDFPLFTPNDDPSEPGQGGQAGYKSSHHPFTSPISAHHELLKTKPWEVLGYHYDIVCNGIELGGGSTRIHSAATQRYVLEEILKLPKDRMDTFEEFLRILDSGCPPHAGIALGFDRLCAVLAGTDSVRDVVAFPKTSSGADAMVKSPSFVDPKTLAEYGIKVVD